MSTASPRPAPEQGAARSFRRRARRWAVLVLVLVLAVLAFLGAARLWTEVLWYRQIGYFTVFLREHLARVLVFLVAGAIMFVAVRASMATAWRTREAESPPHPQLRRYRASLDPARRAVMVLVPGLLGAFAGTTVSAQWQTVALFLARQPFGRTDPEFGLDLGFYVFTLPFLRLLLGLLIMVLACSAIAGLVLHYVYGGFVLDEAGLRTTRAFRAHLGTMAAVLLLLQAANFWLGRYGTLTSRGGKWTGALFTDVNAVIPTNAILAVSALLVAFLFLGSARSGNWRLPLVGTAMLLVVSLVAGGLYPWAVQRFQVTPTEQSREKEYLQRNIAMTRAAYGLDRTRTQDYQATTHTGKKALEQDQQTVDSIRLLDPQVVSSAFEQLQQFRPYYKFSPSLSVDRYTVHGRTEDTVIAARELNPGQNQGWYNQHVVYTHGYGVIAAYGNTVEADGKPRFMQSGIDAGGVISQDYQPRIYFGQDSPEYSVVGGTPAQEQLELDRPQSAEKDGKEAKTTFAGDGGPRVGSWFNRLAYALKFRSSDLLLSDAVRPDSQILYDRDPALRVKKAAPYLTVDGNPYPAVVEGKVQWVVDAYTTSDQYPYSTPTQLGRATEDSQTASGASRALPDDRVNYIRNSVKATVDAYDGSVTLYAWDEQDPVLKAWQKVFPGTVRSYHRMSAQLMDHVRYPEDMFKVQRELLNRYHVTDANSFYAGDDVWQTPDDPTQEKGTTLPPYYLSLQMPQSRRAAFSLTSSFIPQQSDSSTRNVMYGFLAANGDAGTGRDGEKDPDYGRLDLLELPRSSVVPGPGQAQNHFDSDTEVSRELNLLRQGASQVINGNLLTLPVGGGILYVQPVYVQSSGDSSYPTLRRVLVGFGEKVGFAPTLDQALDQVFDGDAGARAGSGAGVDESEAARRAGQDPQQSQKGQTSGDSDDLHRALEEADQAMKDSEAALKKGDWKAYGEAQDRLRKALREAMEAQHEAR